MDISQAYDDSTKVATIYRETTDTIGWDLLFLNTHRIKLYQQTHNTELNPVVVGEPYCPNSEQCPTLKLVPQWSDPSLGIQQDKNLTTLF